ncbi:Oxoglutarate/iron-dependent dioxygenase [Penicillium cf. griseofulvum]|nr:Oxoglutarate/iron-dependent dioxygenase [Penicillium cf. griseofulvum]
MNWPEICCRILLFCLAGGIGFLLRRVYFHPLSGFPGPKLVAASSFQHFYAVWTGREKTWYQDLHRRYGPVVRCGPNHLTFNDLDLIPVVYHRQSDKTDYPQDFTCPGAATNKAGYLEYAAAKRQFGQAFSVSRVQLFEGLVDENLIKWVSILSEESHKSPSIDWGTWVKYFSFDVYVPMSVGESFGFLDHKSDVRNMLQSSYRIFRYWTLSRYRPIAWLAAHTALGRRLFVSGRDDPTGMGMWTTEVHDITRRRMESSTTEEKPRWEHSMLDQWLAAKSAAGEGIPLSDIEDQLVSDVLGGPYALATTLSHLVTTMAKHPQAVQRAQKEIDNAFSQQTLSTPSPTYTECCALPYVDSCVREAMRITATASPRWRCSPDRPLRLLDWDVPPGTAVATSPFTISTHPRLYGDNAEEFVPERWLEASEEQLRVWNAYDAHWGFGYRKCPGRHIGVLVLYKTLVTILRNFDIKEGDSGSSSLVMLPRQL